jgi:branched-chain amino acid transport system ATP-binding protein
MLSCSNIAKRFGGLQVLTDVSFTAEKGLVTALIGPNGAGKSTLVNIISGVLAADQGRVFVDGQDLTGSPAHKTYQSGISRTFQVAGNVGTLNVFESVAVAAYARAKNTREANRLAREELERFDLWDFRNDQLGDIPSAAMRLVDFARGMVSRPKVLLLDEVMAGLTPVEVELVIEQVRRCRDSGVAVVMIEHVMQAVRALADTVVVLNQGIIISSGSFGDISTDPQVVEAYLGQREEH